MKRCCDRRPRWPAVLGSILGVVLVLWLSAAGPVAAEEATPAVVQQIAAEVTRLNTDPGGRPLPVVSHWANSFGRNNFSSDYQIGLLAQGHHIMPTLPFPNSAAAGYDEAGKPWVEKLSRWKAPFSLRAGQWEAVLYDKKQPHDNPGKWRDLPADKSPLEIDHEGKILKLLSPFGAVDPWYEAGVYATHSPAFAQLQQWYPDPPLVILLSNNEAGKLKPKLDVEKTSKRYVDAHGRGKPGSYIRGALAKGYLERYAALLKGVREGLASPVWRQRAKLVAYEAFGPEHLGRWDGWEAYSLATEEQISPWHLVWEGGSPSYYTHNWNASTDYRVWSPQVEANNWVFMLEEAYRDRPEFWFEISVWDGNEARTTNPKKKSSRKMDQYIKAGQTWSPERYAGFVQFGMWLLTPRVIREFRGSSVPRQEFHQDFEALVAAVDRVWQDPVLTRFWRASRLVPNRSHKHPYQTKIPAKWNDVDRWYLLNTSLDAPWPWAHNTEIPVFSLARVLGEPGDRQWLVYAHAPVQARSGVEIEIPEYGKVKVDVTPAGSFYLVREKDRSVTPVLDAKNAG